MARSWKELEEVYTAHALREALRIIRNNPRHTFYAVALQESYRELDGQICLPCLALNSIEAHRKQHGDSEPYDMGSANWRWRLQQSFLKHPQMRQLQEWLDSEANRNTQAHWFHTEKRFLSTMVRIARHLHASLKKHKHVTRDFCVYFDDEDDDSGDLVRRCLPKSLFLKHFHGLVEEAEPARQLKKLSGPSKLERYLADIDEHEDEIAALGEAAIDGLVAKLKDQENGHKAAMLLGRIGIATKPVIRGLRQMLQTSPPGSFSAMWSASALASLGDDEFLFKIAEDDSQCKAAIEGLCFPYRGLDDWPRPKLDYRNLERILDRGSKAWTRIAAKELEPGSGFVEIEPDEVDEAIRGLQSPHLVIHQHAVCILGERGLGAAAGKRILPALAKCLEDPHPNMRRLAIFSISEWKAAAKPYRPDIKRLLQDKNASVREMARSALR
jgi:hypothetical protein